ncbi:MAG TPA: hypothetical protein VGH19_09325 [Verrucomicrobiae bacterium]
MTPTAKVMVSLCLNIGLGFAWILNASPKADVSKQAPAGIATHPAKKAKTPAPTTITNIIPNNFKWQRLESEDYKEYIRNLRTVNCPEATIRDIILADLDNLYEPKLNPLRRIMAAAREQRYGQPVGSPVPKVDPSVTKTISELESERASLIQELLGVSERSLRAAYHRHEDAVQGSYAFLSAEQREKLIGLEKKYDLYPDDDGREGGLRFHRLELPEEQFKEMRSELAQFMTPEQIREYDLRTSKIASSMRSDFYTIGVKESEFRSSYDAYQAWDKARDELFDFRNPPTDERRAELKRDEQKAIDQMKASLTPERYAEFRLFRDMAYAELYLAAPYLGFPREAAKKVVDMRVDVNKAVAAVRNDQSLTEEVRQQKLLAIRDTTEKTVIGVIGERGYKYYKRQGGRWMNGISPRIQKEQP